MNILSHLNYLAVLAGAAGYFVLGALWYSPVLFSKKWVALNNIVMTDDDRQGVPLIMIMSLILMLVISLGLAVLMHFMGIARPVGALKAGMLCGACFSVTALGINYVYLKKPMQLFVIDAGYQFIGTALCALIQGFWI